MPAEPTLAEIITGAIESRVGEIMTATVGKIEKYDPIKQVADISCVIKRPFNIGDGEVDHEELPVLPNVPVLMPRSGGYVIHCPILPGDHVLVIFTHDSIAMWRETGALTEPGDLQRHSLASAVAIAGLAPASKPLMPIATQLAARDAGMVLGKDGGPSQVEIQDALINLGHMAIMPIALAPPTLAAIAALQATVTSLSAAITALAAAHVAQSAVNAALIPPQVAAIAAAPGQVTAAGAGTGAAVAGVAAVAASAAAVATANATGPSTLVKAL